MNKHVILLAAACGLVFPVLAGENATSNSKAAAGTLFFVGTYTGAKSKGIYAFRFNSSSGQITPCGLAVETVNPTWLAVHPSGKYLYAANEIGEWGGKRTGAISSFEIDAQAGRLRLLNQKPSGGGGPCHLMVDPGGKNVLVANYGGGSVEVLPILAGGELGEPSCFIQHRGSSVNRQRQEKPHAHGIYLDQSARFAIVADLGLDQLLVYRFDAEKGTLQAHEPPGVALAPGAGPRHFVFHPNGKKGFVINELSSTLTSLDYDPESGRFTVRDTVSTLPPDYLGKRNSTAEVAIDKTGRFVYGSNRGHDSIAVFRVTNGGLDRIQVEPSGGKEPRFFGFDPTGRWCLSCNQNSDNILVLKADPESGRLSPTSNTASVGAPVCVVFVP